MDDQAMNLTPDDAQTFLDALECVIAKHGGVQGAATHLGVARATIYLWKKKPCIPTKTEILNKMGLTTEVSLRWKRRKS